jgi:hypothetical protein
LQIAAAVPFWDPQIEICLLGNQVLMGGWSGSGLINRSHGLIDAGWTNPK